MERPTAHVLAALLGLVAGAAFYAVVRGNSVLPLLPSLPTISLHGRIIADHLPTFLHPLSFILLTVAVAGRADRAALISITAVWVCLDGVLELLQYPGVGRAVAAGLPSWFDHIVLLDRARSYFADGVFDPWDLVSIGLGGAAACVVSRALRLKRRTRNERTASAHVAVGGIRVGNRQHPGDRERWQLCSRRAGSRRRS